MDTSPTSQTRSEEAHVLAAIGAHLFQQETTVKVRLPGKLADAALRAWHRTDEGDTSHDESPSERLVRHQAGALALIGLAIEERGQRLDGDVVVTLDAWQIGDALNAADDRGEIQPGPASTGASGVPESLS